MPSHVPICSDHPSNSPHLPHAVSSCPYALNRIVTEYGVNVFQSYDDKAFLNGRILEGIGAEHRGCFKHFAGKVGQNAFYVPRLNRIVHTDSSGKRVISTSDPAACIQEYNPLFDMWFYGEDNSACEMLFFDGLENLKLMAKANGIPVAINIRKPTNIQVFKDGEFHFASRLSCLVLICRHFPNFIACSLLADGTQLPWGKWMHHGISIDTFAILDEVTFKMDPIDLHMLYSSSKVLVRTFNHLYLSHDLDLLGASLE